MFCTLRDRHPLFGQTDAKNNLVWKTLLKVTMTHTITDEDKSHLKEKAEREAARS